MLLLFTYIFEFLWFAGKTINKQHPQQHKLHTGFGTIFRTSGSAGTR